MTDPEKGWIEDWGDSWTRTQFGKPGRPGLVLHVFPNPYSMEEPWTWEVLALDDGTEHEVAVGGAVTREAAMHAALAEAGSE